MCDRVNGHLKMIHQIGTVFRMYTNTVKLFIILQYLKSDFKIQKEQFMTKNTNRSHKISSTVIRQFDLGWFLVDMVIFLLHLNSKGELTVSLCLFLFSNLSGKV